MKCKYLILCLTVLLSTHVSAQVENEQDKIKAKRQLALKTFVLADEITNAVGSLKLAENRSFILAAAAELLWAQDQKRARNLFWESLNTINSISDAEGKGGKSKGAKVKRQNSYLTIFQLRQELLRKIAARDAQLALDLMRATRQLPPEQVDPNWRLPDERDLEQQIAGEAAAMDPKLALRIARESLTRGFTFELLNLLSQLNQKDTELGSKFAGEIIEKLRTQELGPDIYGSWTAIKMVLMSRASEKPPDKISAQFMPRQLKLELEQKRELVEMIATAAMSVSASGLLLSTLSEVMPEIEEFIPGRVVQLQGRLRDFRSKLPGNEKTWNDYNSLIRTGTPEDILRAATKGDEEQRYGLEQQAIVLAVFRGKADLLREFITNEIDDQSQRKRLTDSLDAELINYAAHRGDSEALRKLLSQVRLKEERARAMAELAIFLEKKGEHDEALRLLDEAQALIRTNLKSETQTNALLGLVLAYSFVEPEKAFGILERTVDAANDEISKILLLDKLVRTGFVKKGEIVVQNSSTLPLEFALFKYGKGVASLAIVDFDRTKALADRFQRPEIRIMARLLLAQALLKNLAADQGR